MRDQRGRVAAAGADRGRCVRLLVVDDNEVFAKTVTSLLEAQGGIEVVGHAANGRLGVGLAAALAPDVVLMDLDMPVMGGIDATAALAGSGPRVVILTASSKPDDAGRAAEAGAVDLLTKDAPVSRVAAAVLAAAA